MENRLIECFVTHVEREGPLLKVWAQLDRKIPTYIEKAILQLAEQFENPAYKISDPSSIRIRQLCCAKYSDGSYYRARITSLANISAGEVAVQFADYGNHEIIPLNNMRKLDPVVGPLASLPDQATDFYLAGVYPATAGEWSMEMLGYIREAICYSDLGFLHTAECVTDAGKKNFIQLMYDNNDFAAMLISKNMGIAILVDTQKSLLLNFLEKKPLPPLTLWPPFNPTEPPPAAQMMVPASLAAAAQLAVAETHQRRIAQQMPLQPQATNQGFVSSAQRRLIHPKAGYADPGFTPPVQFQQVGPVERNYQPSSAQLRLDQARQQQHDAANQNRLDMAQMQSAQRPYDRSDMPMNNARVRLMAPVDHYGRHSVSQIHAQPHSTEQHFASPPLVQTSNTTPPLRAITNNPAEHGAIHNSKDEVRAAHVFRSHVLEFHTDHEVFVSFAEDGPNGFAVQLSSLEDTLGKLLDEINRDKPSPLTQPLMPGSTCLGRFTLDQTLCRAVVMSVHTDTCQVYYVDFGNSEELPFSDIFELPQHYVIEPQVMAIRFTLSGLGNMTITKQVKEVFCELVNNRQFLLRVVPPEGPPMRQYGILYDEGRSILDILKEKLKAQQVCYVPIALPETGSKEIVTIAYVESLSNFFVQKQDNLEALESVMEELATHCETAAQLSHNEITEGLPCCSLYSGDELWYRAQVKSITDKDIVVDYVDYGNTEPVKLDSLRKISPELVTVMQSQAIACCLNKLQNAEASDEMMDKFALLTDDKSLTLEVCSRLDDGQLVVELHDMMDSMPINIGAALRAPKQPLQQKPIEQARPTPPPAKIVAQPQPVAVDERRESKQTADSYKTYDKPSRDTHNEEKSNQSGGSRFIHQSKTESTRPSKGGTRHYSYGKTRSNVEDWRKRDDDREERPSHFDSNRGKDRDTKDRYQPRSSENEERGGNRFGGSREERGGDRYGDRDDKRGSRFGGDKEDPEERGNNRFGGDRDDKRGNRFGGDRDNKRGNRFSGDKEDREERGNNRFGGDRDDKRGNRFGGDKEDNNRFGADRDDKRGNRFSGDKEDGNRFGGDKKEKYPKDRGDGWGDNKLKTDTWGDSSATKTVVETVQVFATPDQRFSDEIMQPDTNQEVVVIWFVTPERFFVQLTSKQCDIETTMKDIQSAYCGKQANVKDVVVGSPVIAKYQADKVLYRAEVIEVKDYSYVVRYVDFGNCELVKKADLWQIESRFLDLPRQAVLCSLSNVKPVDGDWSKNQEAVDVLFQDSRYQCVFHGQEDGKHSVTLTHDGRSVADELVANGVARTGADPAKDAVATLEEPVEKELYARQTLIGHITYVEGVANFYAHFNVDEANKVQALVDEYVLNPENITPLLADQVSVDGLCIATTDSAQWYRARIVEPAEAEGVYYVTFLDYGNGDEVAVDKMIPLPEQLSLSAHPAQATEMFLTGSDETEVEPETEDLFKANLETTDVVIHVDSVSGERLNVTVFSLDGKKLELVKHIGSDHEVEPVLPHPILSQKVSVFVSHANGPTSVWLQAAKNYEALTGLVDRMYVFYEESGEGKKVEVRVGSLCAAKSVSDDSWYRARVTATSEEGVEVLFVDYGNGEVVPAGNVKALDPSLYTPHTQALNVSLPVVETGTESSDLGEMTSEVEYLAVFHRDEAGRWYSELFNKKETLTDKLVDLGCARAMEGYPFERYVAEITRAPGLVPGDRVSMYVSHVDGPDSFWIQREDQSVEIEELQAELQGAVGDFKELAAPSVDELCAALYQEDCQWYRAMVLETKDKEVLVRFVDYGNTDLVDTGVSKLKTLPARLARREAYATRCGLNVLPLDGEYGEEAVQGFETLVAETEDPLLGVVLAVRECPIVDLFLGDRSFAASLVADDLVAEFVPEDSVYVSHVVSPAEFWTQAERLTARLDRIAEAMVGAADFQPLEDAAVGTLCAALFADDEQWYRALVMSKTDDGTEVQFVDFGNSAVSAELRVLPEVVARLASLARRCCLAGRPAWCDRAAETFLELVAEGTTAFSMEVVDANDARTLVKLCLGGKDVAEMLEGGSEKDKAGSPGTPARPLESSMDDREEEFHDTVENLSEVHEETTEEVEAKETAAPDSDKTMESNQELDVPESDVAADAITEDVAEDGETPMEVAEAEVGETAQSAALVGRDDLSTQAKFELIALKLAATLKMPQSTEDTMDADLVTSEEKSTEDIVDADLVTSEDKSTEDRVDADLVTSDVQSTQDTMDADLVTSEDKSTEDRVDADLVTSEDKSTEDKSSKDRVDADLVTSEVQSTENRMDADSVTPEDKSTENRIDADSETSEVQSTDNRMDADLVTSEVRQADSKQQLPDLVRPGSPKVTGDEDPIRSRPMTPKNNTEKIVPGSIGRGVSLEELHPHALRASPRNRSEKIVPGCVSRGVSDEELREVAFRPINPKFEHSVNLVPDLEVAVSCPATPVPGAERRLQRASSVEMERPSPLKVKHADRIVAGCVSGGTSSEEVKAASHEDFEKLKHWERIVPGSISRGVSVEGMEEDPDVAAAPGNVVNGSGTTKE